MPAQQATTSGTPRFIAGSATGGRSEQVGAFIADAVRLAGVVAADVVSRRPVHPLPDEAVRSLPGDDLVADPKVAWNLATTIDARPAEIWPWLVQMGCRRGGWYSYDGLDNSGVPSVDRIIPELQQVQVGDIFPMSRKSEDMFVVRMIEP